MEAKQIWVCIMQDGSSPNRKLDLASAFEIGSVGTRISVDYGGNNSTFRSVLTIAFQFTFENHLRENVATMARQYLRSVAASV